MSLLSFTPPVSPSLKSKRSVKYRVKNAGFGDGYVQRGADGINTKLVTLDLIWNALVPAQVAAIEAFLDGLQGYQAFSYAFPGDVARKYICVSFAIVQAEGIADTVTATFEEVFDP